MTTLALLFLLLSIDLQLRTIGFEHEALTAIQKACDHAWCEDAPIYIYRFDDLRCNFFAGACLLEFKVIYRNESNYGVVCGMPDIYMPSDVLYGSVLRQMFFDKITYCIQTVKQRIRERNTIRQAMVGA